MSANELESNVLGSYFISRTLFFLRTWLLGLSYWLGAHTHTKSVKIALSCMHAHTKDDRELDNPDTHTSTPTRVCMIATGTLPTQSGVNVILQGNDPLKRSRWRKAGSSRCRGGTMTIVGSDNPPLTDSSLFLAAFLGSVS